MEFTDKYRNQLYGGFLGKVIGVIHGANTEGWTFERIQETFGEITEYPFRFKNFCSDDDVNGPVFYMRALKDFPPETITEQQMAHTLLNYVADGHGFFWWGGYGISTEHTAYENLLNGIEAPESGSIAQNGRTVAEQIGGQIFSDCWGLLCPGDPKRSADFAGRMTSVTHDGNGIYGGRFVAACIAAAYTAENMEQILAVGLSVIPNDCEYAIMARDVRDCCQQHSNDWRASFYYIEEHYGYQHYEGNCHIMPNAAVIVLALMHGGGDFSKTINIANMCGWDTDCNVGNLGAILGVFCGASGIEEKWLGQINDFFCASSVLGYLNIQTVSQAADVAAYLTHQIYSRKPDEIYSRIFQYKEGCFSHFVYPTATQAFRGREKRGDGIVFQNIEDVSGFGGHCLKFAVPRVENGESFYIYKKTYYVPEDFDDSRYNPDFSPTVYPGDQIRAVLRMAKEPRIMIRPYIKNRITGELIELTEVTETLRPDGWKEITAKIPALKNVLVEETGLKFICPEIGKMEKINSVTGYLFEWEVIPQPEYEIKFSALPQERWNSLHELPAHLTYLRGIVRVQDDRLCISGSGRNAEAYTGNIYWDDYEFTTRLSGLQGQCHGVLFRVQGAMRNYSVMLKDNDKLVLSKRSKEERILCEKPLQWHLKKEQEIRISVCRADITIWVNGKLLITYTDEENPLLTGCIGFGNRDGSRTAYRDYRIENVHG